MESPKYKSENEFNKLLGEITEFKSETSDNSTIDNLNVQKGDFIEKYFNQKIKYILNADKVFSNYIDLQAVKEELILSINYAQLNNANLEPNTGKEIIRQVNESLKKETPIQIDSFVPMIDGRKINTFFASIENYSFPCVEKVDEQKKYTLIMESTFCLQSQIVDKLNQLRKSFLLFTVIHKLYESYPKYLESYYKYFIRKYILKENIDKQNIETANDDLDLSNYGNYIFIIATNKTFQSFKEVEYATKKFSFKDNEDDELDYSIKKCFEINDGKNKINKMDVIQKKNDNNPNIQEQNIIENKNPKVAKIYENEKDYTNIIQKVSKSKLLSQTYKSMNNLFQNINKEKNCRVKMLYFDTYLNCVTPKCLLLEKLEKISKNVENQNIKLDNVLKENKSLSDKYDKLVEKFDKLMNHIIKKEPEFDFSSL